ncbi:MAG: ester cyclase [Nitrososphaeria archaeon]|jgi:steroid delta-isomerase-like uncharacterized protein
MVNDIEKILKDFDAVWNLHDVDKAVSFYTDECVLEDLGLGVVCHGKEELAALFKRTFFDTPDLRCESKLLFNAGNWVAWEWTMTGTRARSSNPSIRATGKRFSVRGVSIIEVYRGKINRETDYYNALTLYQQLGLMPITPSK